jgi:uncharacterized protein (DUF1499 family)
MIKKLLFIFPCIFIFNQCSWSRPDNLGITNGMLAPCPTTLNCISSQSTDEWHYTPPLHYTGELSEARKKMVAAIESMDRAVVITEKDDYIHAEYTSRIFRFVDDVELYFDDAHKIIHVRSASRVGYSDHGVNRTRIDQLRFKFNKLNP